MTVFEGQAKEMNGNCALQDFHNQSVNFTVSDVHEIVISVCGNK
jgi:hypothetical protein